MATTPTLILTVNTFNVQVSTEFGVIGTANIMGNNPKGMITFTVFLGSCFPNEPVVLSTSVAVVGNGNYSSGTIPLFGRDVAYSMTATFKSSDTSNTDATSNCADVFASFSSPGNPRNRFGDICSCHFC